MGNCLKTQLKEVVNNNNLPKFGIIEIPVKNTNGAKQTISRIGGVTGHPVHVKITNGTLFNYDESSNYGNEHDFTGDVAVKYIANSDCVIQINKYDVGYLTLEATDYQGNFNTEKFNVFQGKFSDFAYSENLHKLRLTPISGNLLELSKCIYLSELSVQPVDNTGFTGNLSGDILTFVQQQIANGRTAPFTLNVPRGLNRFTFNNKSINYVFNGLVPGVINVELANKINIVDSNNIYQLFIYGYSDSELEANIGAGKLWGTRTVFNVETSKAYANNPSATQITQYKALGYTVYDTSTTPWTEK